MRADTESKQLKADKTGQIDRAVDKANEATTAAQVSTTGDDPAVPDSGAITQRTRKAIDVKGNMYTLMSVVLRMNDLDKIREDLTERVSQAPAFFKNTPVIVDFSAIEIDVDFDFNTLFKTVRQQQLLPVAVRGIDESLHEKFQNMGVPIVELSASAGVDRTAEDEEKSERMRLQSGSRILDTPIRSGQQFAAQTGDLIVTSRTSPDAELIADGSIHVYGPLRGRAMCGVHGDKNARIFCLALEAQLVSIAGHYKVLEEIPASIKDKPVQISLKDDQLLISPL